MTPLQWIMGTDTGTSSKTIWAVMMDAVVAGPPSPIWLYDVPHDPDDFGRCYRLLELFPEWKPRLSEVSERFPAWKPFVDNWEKLSELYLRDLPTGKCSELFDVMQLLLEESMTLDGWVRTSPSGWKREPK